jgi:hypothetical protein
MTPSAWLARVRHDLLKPLLWPARDRREVGGAAAAGELEPSLIDEEGRAITAPALWTALRADAPPGLALEDFEAALTSALAAARSGDVAGVLAIEPEIEALGRLVRNLEGG